MASDSSTLLDLSMQQVSTQKYSRLSRFACCSQNRIFLFASTVRYVLVVDFLIVWTPST
ncbi:hypothetical protein BU25DRAFT_110351 [Macroventuria anomochaeta]|uniref:Uncharacterized protein n=1 Tax=Macroventuria anomochaeta TaxID=301207 RepID=A0ACB6RVL4_9PLEO|nr:uncharacterized protein BU25DRAFT_110351 [Macroventuria anomochaeta]KAF2625742.1 hypothetical protein BU25DRAFT_110351 [Macroventuria anomochaeta]